MEYNHKQRDKTSHTMKKFLLAFFGQVSFGKANGNNGKTDGNSNWK